MMRVVAAIVASVALAAAAAWAQPYPAGRPVKIVVGFPPGGPPDLVARLVAGKLQQRLAAPVVVENRAGASGTIAAAAVARAEPDGHTLLFGVAANLAVAPATMRNPPYDARTAFTPITQIARGPYVWLVRADAPPQSMREFADWARAQSRRLNFGSPGEGSVHHLATELLKQSVGIDLVHVPYKGAPYAALLAGDVDAMFDSLPGPLPYLASGKLRALAVSGAERLPALPGVPTLREQGIALEVHSWWGIVAPAHVPPPVVTRLNEEIRAVLTDDEVGRTLAQWSIAAAPTTPEAFAGFIAEEHARWTAIVGRIGLVLQ